jgi:tetratricopeptide (TPR) repeat protein
LGCVDTLRLPTPQSHERARVLFRRALEVDGSFARAHSGLSLTYFNEWSCAAWERWDETQREAFEHAQRGTQLDDSDSVTHFVLGRVLLYQREYERAERHLDRAEALNPNDADNLAQLALSEALLGRPEHGIEHAALAMRLNPFHEDWYFAFASMPHFYAHNLVQSIDFGLKATDIATDVHAYLAAAYAHLGRDDDAREHVQAFLEMFRRRISCGRDPRPGEALDWMMLVNPLRREADRAYLEDGLVKAGLGRT